MTNLLWHPNWPKPERPLWYELEALAKYTNSVEYRPGMKTIGFDTVYLSQYAKSYVGDVIVPDFGDAELVWCIGDPQFGFIPERDFPKVKYGYRIKAAVAECSANDYDALRIFIANCYDENIPGWLPLQYHGKLLHWRVEYCTPAVGTMDRTYDIAYVGYNKFNRLQKLMELTKELKVLTNLPVSNATRLDEKIGHVESENVLQLAKATIVLGDPGYEYLMPTRRLLQAMAAGTLAFIHQRLDPTCKVYGYGCPLYINSAQEIRNVLEDKLLYKALLKKQTLKYARYVCAIR